MTSSPTQTKKVVIIGAGVGGLTFAIGLKRQLGYDNFTIFDSGNDVGGTWRDNAYPGCASDVPTHWYSLSTDLNPNWEQTHVFQPEIHAYWQDLAHKHEIYPRCVFRTLVVSAEWDEERQLYCVVVKDVCSGLQREEFADVVVSATGLLSIPHYPQIQGIEKFHGPQFHSARWDHNVSLHGKRVAVIGHGCSAIQLVPAISANPATHVINVCRTPSWIFQAKYALWQKWIFAHIPLAIRAFRFLCMLQQEIAYWVLFKGNIRSKTHMRDFVVDVTKKYIHATAPEKYHDGLIPKYPAGCKRLVLDSGYLKALHRPNVQLTFDGIAEVTEQSIVTRKGDEIPVDVIVHATGFTTNRFALVEVKGRNGYRLEEYYQEQGGPTAYFGTAYPNFPNFFTIAGPNTLTGHGSYIFTEEVQANLIIQLVEPIISGQSSLVTVTEQATDRYNSELQSRLASTVWTTCASWYRVGHEGKVTSIFPGSQTEFWWRLRKPRWADFRVVGEARRRSESHWPLRTSAALLCFVVAIVYKGACALA